MNNLQLRAHNMGESKEARHKDNNVHCPRSPENLNSK